jgi:signal transduction histidine kinase/DNA-binding response OmpR family regulator/HAMP domain-containing protein
MGFLRGTSIKARLLRTGLLTAATALITAVLVMSIRDFVFFRTALLRNLAVEAMIVGANSTAALTFENPKDAEETLGALRNSPNIVFARISDKDGAVFAEYRRDGKAAVPLLPPDLRTDGHVFSADRVSLSRPIVIENEFLGTIVIQSDLAEFYHRLLVVNGSAVLIIAITLTIAALLLSKWRHSITDPLQALTVLTQTVSQEKNYSVRAELPRLDELGTLAAGFNDMLAQLQKRDAELAMHHKHLEGLVTKRTTELARTNASLQLELSERERVQGALQQSEEQYRRMSQEFHALLDAIPDSLTLQSPEMEVLWANAGAARGMHRPLEQVVGRCCHELWHDRATPCKNCPVRRSFDTGEPESGSFTTADERTWDVRTVPLKDQHGAVTRVIEVARDITVQRRLEEQLLQSQKIEAVGRLAGGVAHDFNNLTAIVLGYGEMLLKQLPPESPSRKSVEQIVAAGKRSAKLTRQLLAFSRRQLLQPAVLDLNDLLRDLKKMLGRLIGEDVEIELVLAADLGRVTADPGQIEQVVMNLVLNARDAMSRGGKLTLETANVEFDHECALGQASVLPGSYAMLAVTDTGSGMDKPTMARLFEPFFTTKEKGKGTGLGLATAYGIVKQSGGYISAFSEPGKGTTFNIHLPRTDAEPVAKAVEAGGEAPRGNGERILLVEDEASLRELCESVLSGLGYRVSPAGSGQEALALVLEQGLEPDLLVTDVVMPGMSGAELSEQLRRVKSGLRVLFMSGYMDDTITRHIVLDQTAHFIPKPFTERALATKVREALGGETVVEDRGRRVLMIDDDEPYRELVQHFCAKQGHVFAGVDSSAAALAALAVQPFDVLLADLNIPGTSGVRILQEIRAAGCIAPAIVLTGDAASADMDLLLPLGVVRVMEKSSHAEPLLEAIREARPAR